MLLQQGALNVPQIPQFFFICSLPVLKANRPKHWYLQCFDKTTCKKTRCFETIFHNVSAHAPPFKKRSFFTLLLPPLIRTQEDVKSGQIAKLRLNSTFCLSQSWVRADLDPLFASHGTTVVYCGSVQDQRILTVATDVVFANSGICFGYLQVWVHIKMQFF